jgi:DNA repair protein RecN (Recombination protein N)
MEQLSAGHQLLNDEQLGVVGRLTDLKRAFQGLVDFGTDYKTLYDRIQSVLIETDDIASELERLKDGVEADPERLEVVNGQLQKLYDLQKKHHTDSVTDLIEIREELAKKVETVANIEDSIGQKREEVNMLTQKTDAWAKKISEGRKAVIPKLNERLQKNLASLGMPSATFKIEVNSSKSFKTNGKDDLVFLFSANKGSNYGELKKVASGGEMSRIMLTIKSILAEYESLPTMMFDEIDTGVSGEISNRMGEIMQQMSSTMQVFSITHLPQVASKGSYQFKVYKQESSEGTSTHIKQLSKDERIQELAEMLGGKSLSESALAHARELLQ